MAILGVATDALSLLTNVERSERGEFDGFALGQVLLCYSPSGECPNDAQPLTNNNSDGKIRLGDFIELNDIQIGITEFAVTNKRVIYKRGFIWRQTAEMNMDKVEAVDVMQSIPGRLLDYGTIHVKGTGAGIEHLHRIASPIALRNAIIAK